MFYFALKLKIKHFVLNTFFLHFISFETLFGKSVGLRVNELISFHGLGESLKLFYFAYIHHTFVALRDA